MDKVNYNYLVRNYLSKDLIGWGLQDNDNGIGISSTPDLKLNNFDFRCDDFKQDHLGEHILFSGCSIAYGSGLLQNEIWTQKIYDKIKKHRSVSGYFNLSMPGISTFEIITNIFKYINKFGKPNTIFINLPNPHRTYMFDSIGYGEKGEIGIKHAIYKNGIIDDYSRALIVFAFQYLFMLETYCKDNNIRLYCFSWSEEHYDQMDLDRFFITDMKAINEFVQQYAIDHPDDKYSITGRDNLHYGTGYHEYWSNYFYDMYMNELDKENVN